MIGKAEADQPMILNESLQRKREEAMFAQVFDGDGRVRH